ncbi:ABC transporter substrate-binding protein [Neorhizobium tomejilense]|uniref:ABC transporter substrate-binding protein n=1 Tax=Neorhizobium tomejilense TaxID=2093828 RepID=UPI003ED0A68A
MSAYSQTRSNEMMSSQPALDMPAKGITDDMILMGMEDVTNTFSLDEENRGFRMAFDERNELGPVHGRRIVWKGYTRSGGGDAEAAVANAKKLVLLDNVFALVNFGGPEAMSIADLAETHRVPFLFPHTTLFASQDSRYVFTSLPHYIGELRKISEYAGKERGFKRIALIRDQNEYGDLYQEFMEHHGPEFGYSLSGTATVKTRDPSDLTQEFESVAHDADAVFMALYPVQAKAAMVAKAKSGWSGHMIASGPLADEQYLGGGGASAEGTIGLCHFPDPEFSEEPGMRDYRAVLARHHPGGQPNRYTLYGYVYGKLILDALERAGRYLTRETFIAAMEATTHWQSGGIIPPVSLSKSDHHAQRAGLVSEIRNGRFVPLSGWVE